MSTLPCLYPSRKSIRLGQSVYLANGLYFITLCTRDKRCLFGFIENDCLHPTLLGLQVQQQIDRMQNTYPGMTIEQSVVMPNHVHLLIARENGTGEKIPTLGRFLSHLKERVSKQCGESIWQRGYYDHIVRTPADLARIREYIANNPRKWELDCEYSRE